MLEKLNNIVFSNNDVDLDDIDSDIDTFFSDNMGLVNIDLNNINRDGNNFDEDDPETIIHVGLMAWHNRFKQCKPIKKMIGNELMPIEYHVTNVWDWCMTKNERLWNDKSNA